MVPLATVQILIRWRFETDADPEHEVERSHRIEPAVEAEGVFVQIGPAKKKELVGEFKMRDGSGIPKASRPRCGCMISRMKNWARRSPMVSTTSVPTPAGSVSGSITIPRSLRWNRFSAGGGAWDAGLTPTRKRCSSPPMAGEATARGRDCGRWRFSAWLTPPACVSRCVTSPGTSKWYKIEHRMFCHITENWRG